MKTMISSLFVLMVSCLAFTVSSYAQIGPTFKASRMIGTELRDQSGRTIGKIEDFIIDPSISRVIGVTIQESSRSTSAVPFNVITESRFSDKLVYNPSEAAAQLYGQAPYWSENPYISHPYPEGSYKGRRLIGATVRASYGETSRIRDLEFSSLDGSVYAIFPFRVQGTVETVKVPLSYLRQTGEESFEVNFVNTNITPRGRNIRGGSAKRTNPYQWGGEAQDF